MAPVPGRLKASKEEITRAWDAKPGMLPYRSTKGPDPMRSYGLSGTRAMKLVVIDTSACCGVARGRLMPARIAEVLGAAEERYHDFAPAT